MLLFTLINAKLYNIVISIKIKNSSLNVLFFFFTFILKSNVIIISSDIYLKIANKFVNGNIN